MKKLFLLSVLILIFACEKDYVYKHDTSLLAGDWYGIMDDNLVNLNLAGSGSYDYTELTSDSSLIYSETGVWSLMYLQIEDVSEIDFELPNNLVFEVKTSTINENVRKKDYIEFEYFQDGGLSIYFTDGTLTLQK